MTDQTNINLMGLQRRFKDIGIGGMAAHWYDSNTRKHRLEEMGGYAQEVSRHLQAGSAILEVAPGPGYLAIELAKMGQFRVAGLDISKDFVEIAQRNAEEAGVEIEFRQGSVADIPFPDNKFDFIVCTAAFKNFKEPLETLEEMHRVLRPQGIALIVDMNRHASDQQIEGYTDNMEAKGVDRLLMHFMFKHFLRKGAYTKDEFVSLISKTAFRKYSINEVAMGFHIYLTK